MPVLSDKELEERLRAAGNTLLQPPSSPDELLPLLDRTEELLSKVEQSPPKSMQSALSLLMKALVAENLVKHSDVDVKVGVASCISEVTRITAPDAPYDDEKMKDVFQLIVSSFQNLSDISSRSHEKRSTILETVAKVRSCVIMLDLECDKLIVEMFQHFLNAIRVNHAEVIFASMEMIMTLVLEESEDISMDLLNPILSALKKNNEVVMPIAKKLAERVTQNCADKLRPYLTQAVKVLDSSLDDYSEVLASVCVENAGTMEHRIENSLEDKPVVQRKSTNASPVHDMVTQVAEDGREETNIQDKDPDATRSPNTIVSPGISVTGTEETMTGANYSNKPDSIHQLGAELISKAESDYLGDKKSAALGDNVERAKSEQAPCKPEFPIVEMDTSLGEAEPDETAKFSNKGNEATIQLSQTEASENEAVCVASPTQSSSVPHAIQPEKDTLLKGKENLVREETFSVDSPSEKVSEGEYGSEEEKQRRLGKERVDEPTDKDKALTEECASKNDDGSTSNLELRSMNQTEKLAGVQKIENSLMKKDGKKSGRVKPRLEKNVLKSSAIEDIGKGTATSPRSPIRATRDEVNQEETPRTSTKRKRTPSTEKGTSTSPRSPSRSTKDEVNQEESPIMSMKRKRTPSTEKGTATSPRSPLRSTKGEVNKEETPRMSMKRKRTPSTEKTSEGIEYGANLVGSKVKVWWPKDRMFYEGVISSFDSVKKKHKVVYTDGDKEILNLRKERWEFITDDLASDEGQAGEPSTYDASSDVQRKKKGNRNSATSTKHRKMEGSRESKLKDMATRTGGKSKDDGKADPKSKDHNSKTRKKSEDEAIKTKNDSQKLGVKCPSDSAKVGVANTASHSRQESQRSVESKSRPPQSGKNLSANSSRNANSGSKVKGTERDKEKTMDLAKSSETARGNLTDAAKSQKSETKSGQKRRR